MRQQVLVTGGAGFIGSHTLVEFAEHHDLTVLDNFSNAVPEVIERVSALIGRPVPVHHVDLRHHDAVRGVFANGNFDAVVHFAGHKAVGESVSKPLEYYDNNIGGTLSLVRAMQEYAVRRLVFSSSATVYGATPPVPMTEDLPTSATNPYGWTKVMIEQILRDVAAADPTWRIALLRYFNPVGAHSSGRIGEDPHGIPNNLMPFIAQVAVGRRERLQVFGADYDTSDGTGVRDYIHVVDLARGHLAALEQISSHDAPLSTWNLGSGRGTSVLELIAAFEGASGRAIPYDVVERRPGDIATSYADPSRANQELGWSADLSVADMCADTWRWQQANPQGYASTND